MVNNDKKIEIPMRIQTVTMTYKNSKHNNSIG